MLPAGIPAPDVEGRQLYSLLLSHLVGDLDDSGQGLKGEGMQTFLDRMIWADPSLVFLSLLPSSGEG